MLRGGKGRGGEIKVDQGSDRQYHARGAVWGKYDVTSVDKNVTNSRHFPVMLRSVYEQMTCHQYQAGFVCESERLSDR